MDEKHSISVSVTDYNYIYFAIKLHNFIRPTCNQLLPKTCDGICICNCIVIRTVSRKIQGAAPRSDDRVWEKFKRSEQKQPKQLMLSFQAIEWKEGKKETDIGYM